MSRTLIDSSLVPSASTSFQNINNIIDNGGFEIWQRGTSFNNPTAGTYTADRWQQQGNTSGASWTVSQSSSTVDTGNFSITMNVTATGTSTSNYLSQPLEMVKNYTGKTLTFSIRINTSLVNKIGIELNDGFTNVQSTTHPGGGVWQTLSCTINVNSAVTQILCHVGWVNGTNISTGSFFADSAMLVIGPNAASFVPLNPQQDLARCQRFYLQINATNDSLIAMMQCTSTTAAVGRSYFPTQMRTTPTATVTNGTQAELLTATGGGVGLSTITPSPSTRGCQWNVTVASSIVAGNASALIITGVGFVVEFSADL